MRIADKTLWRTLLDPPNWLDRLLALITMQTHSTGETSKGLLLFLRLFMKSQFPVVYSESVDLLALSHLDASHNSIKDHFETRVLGGDSPRF